jgi:hypothetical protein
VKRLAIVLALALLCTSVPAQQSQLPTGPGGIPDPNQSQFPQEGAQIPPIGSALNPGGGGGGPACTAGAFDLSLATGCNIPFYLDGVIP